MGRIATTDSGRRVEETEQGRDYDPAIDASDPAELLYRFDDRMEFFYEWVGRVFRIVQLLSQYQNIRCFRSRDYDDTCLLYTSSNALYQYTIQADNVADLQTWGPKLLQSMMHLPGFQDVSSDQQNGGLDELLTYDRVTAAKLGQTASSLDSALYGAFGQSEVCLLYTSGMKVDIFQPGGIRPVLRRDLQDDVILVKLRVN